MPDREKVIDALTACARGDITCKLSGCPYWGEYDDCIGKMARDALELLKGQEPRVLTLEEVMALPNGEEDEAVVVREFRLPIGKVWNGETVCRWMGARDVQNAADWVYGFFHKSEYGHNWRCWTAMPTKVQREAVKWNA